MIIWYIVNWMYATEVPNLPQPILRPLENDVLSCELYPWSSLTAQFQSKTNSLSHATDALLAGTTVLKCTCTSGGWHRQWPGAQIESWFLDQQPNILMSMICKGFLMMLHQRVVKGFSFGCECGSFFVMKQVQATPSFDEWFAFTGWSMCLFIVPLLNCGGACTCYKASYHWQNASLH